MAGNSGPRFADHVYHGGCRSKISEYYDDSSLVSLFASLNPNCMLIILCSNFDGSGVSSFNEFIHELSVDSDTSSLEYSSGEDSDGALPASPSSQSSRLSWASASANSESHWTEWITFILWWLIFPVRILLWVPQYFMILFFKRIQELLQAQEGTNIHLDLVLARSTQAKTMMFPIELLIEDAELLRFVDALTNIQYSLWKASRCCSIILVV